MNTLNFQESISKLHGKILTAKSNEGTFKIETCLFTRNSFTVIFCKENNSCEPIAHYVSCVESAKKLCEAFLLKAQ